MTSTALAKTGSSALTQRAQIVQIIRARFAERQEQPTPLQTKRIKAKLDSIFQKRKKSVSGRRREARANAKQIGAEVFRHRIDWHWLPDGRIEAILTVTLPDGHMFRFTSQADPKEIAAALVAARPQVGGFLGSIWKGIKKVAKGVATSGVFKAAGKALAFIAPALGPLAPVAMAAGAAVKGTTALLAARSHAAKGNKAAADQLVKYASKATGVAAKLAPPKAAARAKSPATAAAQAHLDQAQQSSAKIYSLLLKPA